MIYQEKNGGLNWNFKMKNLLTVSLNGNQYFKIEY